MSEANSSNYFSVAVVDTSKAESRKLRIEAAVQRSKTEYTAIHAYTERDNALREKTAVKAKVDRQQLEFLISALYYAREYSRVIQLVLDAMEPKSLGGLGREIIDTGIKAAIRARDEEAGLRLARLTSDQWKGQSAGLAASAADAFLTFGQPRESLGPLLLSIASYGLHEPMIMRLLDALDQCQEVEFAAFIRAVRDRQNASIDKEQLQRSLPIEGLVGTLQRLEKATRGQVDETEEKSVRQL